MKHFSGDGKIFSAQIILHDTLNLFINETLTDLSFLITLKTSSYLNRAFQPTQ